MKAALCSDRCGGCLSSCVLPPADWACTCLRYSVMHLFQLTKSNALAFALLLPSLLLPVSAQSTDPAKPDNTAVNKRDQSPGEATADQQKMNAADRALTAKIRKAVMADKSLSTYAHNVKIISQNGTVTLKGPVHSDDEVNSIMAKAAEGAGSPDKIVNQMSVKP
jgi:hyperosmotically inducible periplasmic protein